MSHSKRGFIRKQVAEILGMRPHTIQFYTDRKLIEPDVYNPKGRGTTRKYSKKNLVELLITRELAKKGIRLTTIKTIISLIKTMGPAQAYYLDPDDGWLDRCRVFFMIYETDSNQINVEAQFRRDPDKYTSLEFSENQINRLKKLRDNLEVNMENSVSVLIIDVSKLWGEVSARL